MAAPSVYENLCRIGTQRQSEVTAETNALRNLVIKAQRLDARADSTQAVIDQRAHLDEVRIEMSRHVAHCTDGCKRISDPSTVFSDPQYERAPAHKKPAIPPPTELAQLLQDGHDLEDLAEQYERHVSTLRQHLSRSGFSSTTGEAKKVYELDTPALHKPFGYEQWMDDGLCAQTDPDSFFPEKGGSTREAKAVCAGCTVAFECLEYALTNSERFGIWGGLSERERRALTRPSTPDFPTDGNDIHHQETA